MQRATARTSRRWRRCSCGRAVMPGERYVELVISPDHDDVGNAGWWRAVECSTCATRKGRGSLLELAEARP